MDVSFEQKYLKYKNKYKNAKKINNQINYINKKFNLFGGDCKPKLTYDPLNFESFIKYITNKYECTGKNIKTTNKYFVILYGPPASGKTLAKKIATQIIKNNFDEQLGNEDIFKTFIDSSVDELTYDKLVNGTTTSVIDLLLETLNKKIITENIDKNKLRPFINDIVDDTFKIYKENRADSLSELMIFLASFLNKNIFFETSTAGLSYIHGLLDILTWHNYKPILIYPYTNDVRLLYERSIDRGLKEGRFLKCYTAFGLNTIYDKNVNTYNEEIVTKKFMDPHKIFLIYRYNANIEKDDYDSFNKFNFEKLDTYFLSSYFKNDGKIITEKFTNIIDNKINCVA
jgi:hypothetical protein